jgi:type I restriction enzyme, S subunit
MSKSLEEIAHIFSGTDYKKNPPGDSVPIYGTGGLMGFTSTHLQTGPAVLSGRKGSINNPIYVEGAFWNVDTIYCIKTNEGINTKWLFYNFLNTDLTQLNEATGVPSVNSKALYKLKFKWFELPEQTKIAHILSTCDAVIEKTKSAIAKYKAIKQGMLHDLFTRGIDINTGKLRPKYEDVPELYKESKLGWVPGEWEILSIADISENLDGNRIPVKQSDRDRQAKIFPYYGASGIIDYVEDYIFDEPLILLGEDGENVISRNLPLAFKVEGKIWVNNHAHVLKPINGISLIEFLCEALESIDYSSIVSGSAQPKITQGHLSKILLKIPQIKEQEIISQRIVSLNIKLKTEQLYLQKLQSIKQGLMGDLLSGRRSVNTHTAVNKDTTDNRNNVEM